MLCSCSLDMMGRVAMGNGGSKETVGCPFGAVVYDVVGNFLLGAMLLFSRETET